MKKILIISDNNSIWTKKCILHSSIINDENDIYVLCDGVTKNDSFYTENGITIFRIKKHDAVYRIPKVGGAAFYIDYLRSIRKICKKIGGFDIVHISYITKSKMLAVKLLRKYCDRIICTFWGSDLFRENKKNLLQYEKYLRLVDIITLSTTEMKNKFLSVYGEGLIDKIQMIRFGIEGLEQIDPDKNAADIKAEYEIPFGKTVVTVGYNGQPAQNHLPVLDSLAMMSNETKSKVYIQIPATYGLTDEYKEKLVQKLEGTDFGYRIIDTFLDDKEIGNLRKSSDVFIHAQVTDASSASVQEYLYARKIAFNPNWIPYSDFKNNGIFYYEYSTFDELRNMLEDILVYGIDKETKEKLNRNSEIIWELSSWDSVSEKWRQLFDFSDKSDK